MNSLTEAKPHYSNPIFQDDSSSRTLWKNCSTGGMGYQTKYSLTDISP